MVTIDDTEVATLFVLVENNLNKTEEYMSRKGFEALSETHQNLFTDRHERLANLKEKLAIRLREIGAFG